MKKDILTVPDIVDDFAEKLKSKDTQRLIRLDSVFVCLLSYALTFDPGCGGIFEPEDRPKLAQWAQRDRRQLPRRYQKAVREEIARLKAMMDSGAHQEARAQIEALMGRIERQLSTEQRQPPPGYSAPEEEVR
jgi:hypothetical protein